MARTKKPMNLDLEFLKNLTNTEIKKFTNYIDKENIELTIKQRKFAYFYVMCDLNHLEAARMAGYSEKGIYGRAHLLLRNATIKKAIKLITEHEIKVSKDVLEWNIFKIFKDLINYDILDYMDEHGVLKTNLYDIPKSLRKLVTKVETKFYGKDAKEKVTTLEFMGKEWAINNLMKYIKMIKDEDNKNTLTDDVMNTLMDKLHGRK
jgi:phage terminase small subunit